MEQSITYTFFIQESHYHCSLDNFDWEGKATLKLMVEGILSGERKKGLVLIGDPGVGKTHLMVGLFRKLLEMGKLPGADVLYLEWQSFLQNTFDTMKIGVKPENVINCFKAGLYIVDDIRPIWSGRMWADTLKRLIEKVYEEKSSLVLSTNAGTVDELIKRWDLEDYWMSRLCSVADIVLVKGEDRRVSK